MLNSFPQELRLKTSAQFKRVFDRAQKISTKKIRIFYCANGLTHPRLGVIVAKKNFHDANKRNSFKRITRESFRYKQHELGNYDYIVFAHKEASIFSKKELRQCLDQQWEKLAKPVNK
jgi:ribonuclease P protein component